MNQTDKLRKDLRRNGFDGLDELVRAGVGIEQFSTFHFRIAERLDIYPNARRRIWKWHNIETTERGEIDSRRVAPFVTKYLAENPPIEKMRFTHDSPEPRPDLAPAPDPGLLGAPHRVGRDKLRMVLFQLYENDRPFEELWAWIEFEFNPKERSDNNGT